MNKVILIGRLTKDPDLSFAAGKGTAVCRFSIAINRIKRKDKEKAEADFINCVAFGKTGETIAQYFTKGKQIAIQGNIRTGSYEGQDGIKRYTTDVVIETFEFVGDKTATSNNKTGEDGQFSNSEFDESMMPVEDETCPWG